MSKYRRELDRLSSMVKDIKTMLEEAYSSPDTIAECDSTHKTLRLLGDYALQASDQTSRVIDSLLALRVECAKTQGCWTVSVSHGDAPTHYHDFDSYVEAIAWVKTLPGVAMIDGESARWLMGRVYLDPVD